MSKASDKPLTADLSAKPEALQSSGLLFFLICPRVHFSSVSFQHPYRPFCLRNLGAKSNIISPVLWFTKEVQLLPWISDPGDLLPLKQMLQQLEGRRWRHIISERASIKLSLRRRQTVFVWIRFRPSLQQKSQTLTLPLRFTGLPLQLLWNQAPRGPESLLWKMKCSFRRESISTVHKAVTITVSAGLSRLGAVDLFIPFQTNSPVKSHIQPSFTTASTSW